VWLTQGYCQQSVQQYVYNDCYMCACVLVCKSQVSLSIKCMTPYSTGGFLCINLHIINMQWQSLIWRACKVVEYVHDKCRKCWYMYMYVGIASFQLNQKFSWNYWPSRNILVKCGNARGLIFVHGMIVCVVVTDICCELFDNYCCILQ
jgi:hypothetical protein